MSWLILIEKKVKAGLGYIVNTPTSNGIESFIHPEKENRTTRHINIFVFICLDFYYKGI